jgi:hypothetical protein
MHDVPEAFLIDLNNLQATECEFHNYCFTHCGEQLITSLAVSEHTQHTSPMAVIKLSKAVRNCARLLLTHTYIFASIALGARTHKSHYSVNSQKPSSQPHTKHILIIVIIIFSGKKSPVAVFSFYSSTGGSGGKKRTILQ